MHYDDKKDGYCDCCSHYTMVIPECGSDAEDICQPCMDAIVQEDYEIYRALLEKDLERASIVE